jgi:formylglycine-generating enzyme required for sulfatase activity
MSDAPRRVFISYSQDSDEHGARVLALAQWLREQGIDAWLDQFEDAPAQGWPMWMHEQLRDADVVLVVASRGYHDKFERSVPRGVGKGIKFESHLLVNEFYELEARTNRFVPVAFEGGDLGFVPKPLSGHTHYVLPGRREALRDWLLGRRPEHKQPRPLGSAGTSGEASPAGDSGGGSSRVEPSSAVSPKSPAGDSPALAVWREKVVKDIEEARAKIRELQPEAATRPPASTPGLTPEQAAAARRRQIAADKRAKRRGHEFAAGELIGGRYELFERVASGGFAEVWKAVDLDDGQLVAVKILHGQWRHDQSRIDRFVSGAKHMDALRHPGIVAVCGEVGTDEERHFYAMPWYAGGDLRRAILTGALDRERGLDALASAIEGLVHAHARGRIHRDVKPHNVLIDGEGRGAISDFDLVLAEGSTQGTRTGMGLGSIVYAAPEALADGGAVDVRADVYGAGMSVVFVLTGKDPLPYVALAKPEVIDGLECDARLREAVRGALAYEREDRKTTCAGLIAAIRGRGMAAGGRAPEPVIRSARGNVELVWIPGGEFMMGSPEGEGYENERPRHRVVLDGFYLARTPVTNASYQLFLAGNPKVEKPRYWEDARFHQPNQPVVGVSWHEAVAFCEWAGLVLPTEAQWEYACRAGTTSRYSSGDDDAALAEVGWYSENSGKRLHAVAELPANAWGLHDMHGNVWEWCRDARAPYNMAVAPGNRLRGEPVPGDHRVMRGGSFVNSADVARSAYRFDNLADVRSHNLGFRPALAHF